MLNLIKICTGTPQYFNHLFLIPILFYNFKGQARVSTHQLLPRHPMWPLVVFYSLLILLTAPGAWADSECYGGGTCYNVLGVFSIDDVPWQNLSMGDTVRIHYRSESYQSNIKNYLFCTRQ